MLLYQQDAYHAGVYQAERCDGSPVRDDVEWIYRLFISLGYKHLRLLETVSDVYLFKYGLLIPSAEDLLLLLLLWYRPSITFRQHLERLPSLPLRLQFSIALHPEDVAVASLPKLEHLSLD